MPIVVNIVLSIMGACSLVFGVYQLGAMIARAAGEAPGLGSAAGVAIVLGLSILRRRP